MPRFKDQAICIRHIDWSETSQVVALLTAKHGKVRGLAKGSKRASPSAVARFSGGIELLTLGEAVGMIRPSSDLASLTEWDLQQPYAHLRRDLAAQQTALYAADLAHAMLADHDPHSKAFTALAGLLDELARPERREPGLLKYQWLLLDDCGYRPQLDNDVQSGASIVDQPTYVFDPRVGGLSASPPDALTDTQSPAGPWRVRRATVEVLRGLTEGGADAPSQTVQRANRLLCVYARAILDRQLPTMAFVLGEGHAGA